MSIDTTPTDACPYCGGMIEASFKIDLDNVTVRQLDFGPNDFATGAYVIVDGEPAMSADVPVNGAVFDGDGCYLSCRDCGEGLPTLGNDDMKAFMRRWVFLTDEIKGAIGTAIEAVRQTQDYEAEWGDKDYEPDEIEAKRAALADALETLESLS